MSINIVVYTCSYTHDVYHDNVTYFHLSADPGLGTVWTYAPSWWLYTFLLLLSLVPTGFQTRYATHFMDWIIDLHISAYFLKQPSSAPLHTLYKIYDVPFGFVTPPSYETLVSCIICGPQRMAVTWYQMICLVFIMIFYFLIEKWNRKLSQIGAGNSKFWDYYTKLLSTYLISSLYQNSSRYMRIINTLIIPTATKLGDILESPCLSVDARFAL